MHKEQPTGVRLGGGTAVAVATGLLALLPSPALAAFPGANGRIAFFQGDVGAVAPHGISTVRADGSDLRPELGPTCQEGEPRPCPNNPAWSPDGARIAFDLGGRIGTMRADGSDVRLLSAPGVGAASRPAWSADGRRLLFDARANGRRNVYTALADGTGGLIRLTGRGGSQAASSPTGRLIAFQRRGAIYLVRPSGGRVRRLVRGSQPNWSPSGGALALARRHGGRVRLYTIRPSGRGLRRLTLGAASEPAWSPAGDRILFERGDIGNSCIYSVRPSGRGGRGDTCGEEGRGVFVYAPDQQPLP